MKKCLIFLICYLLLYSLALAGTFRNDCTMSLYCDDLISNKQVIVKPGETCQSYILLDEQGSTCWTRISELPLPPLAKDYDIETSSNSTEAITTEVSWSMIRLTNESNSRVRVYVNSPENPYPSILEAQNSNNDRDELIISNNYHIHTLYLQFLSTSGGRVKVEEIP